MKKETTMNIAGEYGTAIVFADTVEDTARNQVETLMNQPMTEGGHVRIMPDVHAGAGCVIGYTAHMTDKVVPNLIGVDIGCGVVGHQLGPIDRSFVELDEVINRSVPSGFSVREKVLPFLTELYERMLDTPFNSFENGINEICDRMAQDTDRVWRSIGTLGGGNHFIEVAADQTGEWWLVIHSGSRNFGLKVANYHQKIAQGQHPEVEKSLAYLEGELADQYISDMTIAQEYAELNRATIGYILLSDFFGLEDPSYALDEVESVHNFIDPRDKIIRKGAIRAYEGEQVIIPFNMAFGSIVGTGKSNAEWNFSAAHGAGRVMGRKQAKRELELSDFEAAMGGIYSTTVTQNTLDEAPMAYKDPETVLANISQSIAVTHRLKPLYNFKAGA